MTPAKPLIAPELAAHVATAPPMLCPTRRVGEELPLALSPEAAEVEDATPVFCVVHVPAGAEVPAEHARTRADMRLEAQPGRCACAAGQRDAH